MCGGEGMGGSLWEVVGFSTEVIVSLTQKKLEQGRSQCIDDMQLFCSLYNLGTFLRLFNLTLYGDQIKGN